MKLQRFLITLLSCLLIFPPQLLAALAPVSENQPSAEVQLQKLNRIISFAQEFRNHIDRSAFDLDALLDSLDYESAPIINFVKESIGFEQYAGVMRGPGGTLASRAGNSLDQSLLLSKLLRDAGFDARIVRGKLNQQQVNVLLREMNHRQLPGPPIGNTKEMLRTLNKFGLFENATETEKKAFTDFINHVPSIKSAPYYSDVIETGKFISNRLKTAGVSINGKASTKSLEKEAMDYFWVQHKANAAGVWKNIHPVFSDQTPFDTPEIETVYSKSIPEALQHRVRFQVFIERVIGGKLEVIPVTKAWERPASNMIAIPLSYSNIPDSLLSSPLPGVDLEKRLEAAEYFVPAFGSGIADGAVFFDLQGNIIDPMAASNQAAGVVKKIGKGFSKATANLGGEKLLPKLTAQWLEFTFIAPGGDEQTYRRTTFDRIGPVARASGSIPENLAQTQAGDVRSLFQRHTFMLTTGTTPRGQAMDYALERLVRIQPALEAVMHQFEDPDSNSRQAPGELADIQADWPGHLMLFAAMDGAQQLSNKHRIYRSAPALVIQREGPSTQSGSMAAIDIVRNPMRAISLEADTIRHDPAVMIQIGTWETAQEGIVLQQSNKIFNTSKLIDAAISEGADIKVIKPGDPLGKLKLPPDVLYHVKNDLKRGFAVVIPGQSSNQEMLGWWRINLDDGETLGQLGDGRGSIIVEDLSTLSFGFSVAMLAAGWFNCYSAYQENGNSSEATCCITSNFIFFGIGYLGGVVAAGYAPMYWAGAEGALITWSAAKQIAAGSVAFDVVTYFASICPAPGG